MPAFYYPAVKEEKTRGGAAVSTFAIFGKISKKEEEEEEGEEKADPYDEWSC